MTLLSMILGLLGLALLCSGAVGTATDAPRFFIGLILLLVGALLYVRAHRASQRRIEEQRHREVLDAMRRQ